MTPQPKQTIAFKTSHLLTLQRHQFTKLSRARILHLIGQSLLKVNLVYLVNCTMASQRPTFRIFSFFSTSLGW